jgi:hypothetical protein
VIQKNAYFHLVSWELTKDTVVRLGNEPKVEVSSILNR